MVTANEQGLSETAVSWEKAIQKTSKRLQRRDIDCSQPFPLSNGCSRRSIASIAMNFDGSKLRVAASADGHVVLLRSPQTALNAAAQFATFTAASPRRTRLEKGLAVVRAQLRQQGIELLATHEVREERSLVGYYLVADRDIFSLLQASFSSP